MSLTPAGGCADRSFELVRQSLLQSEELPFQDALTAAQIRRAFDAAGVAFGQTDDRAQGAGQTGQAGIVYTEGVTLWAMLSQALCTDVQRACVAAVQRVAVSWVLLGRETPLTDTGGNPWGQPADRYSQRARYARTDDGAPMLRVGAIQR